MTNNDNEFKKTFETFVGQLEEVNVAVGELKPLEEKYFTAIESESTIIAAVEKYCGFLQIEAANAAAKNDEESNNFKQSLSLEKGKLQDIISTLNDCKSGLKESSTSLKDMVVEFSNCINTHLNTINGAITKASSYLEGYIPTEKEEAAKDNTEVLELQQDMTKDEDLGTKVVSVEPQPNIEIPTDVQDLNIDQLTSELNEEMKPNSDNLAELEATKDEYTKDDESENNIVEDNKVDESKANDEVNISNPGNAFGLENKELQPEDSQDLDTWFNENITSEDKSELDDKVEASVAEKQEEKNVEPANQSVDDTFVQVTGQEPMFEASNSETKAEENSNDLGLTLEKSN